MAKKVKQEEGAPAYMAQFTALMTLLLAFFITLLTLGSNRVSQYKKEGVGFIRDAFGASGGMGVMSFMKSMMKHYPEVRKEEDKDEAELLGYEKGSFESEILDAEGISKIEVLDLGYDIRILLPPLFETSALYFRDDAVPVLGRIGGVLYGLTNHVITVCSYTREGSGQTGKEESAKRSYVIAKYLSENVGIPEERLNAVGAYGGRYIGVAGVELPEEGSCLVVRKRNLNSRSSVF